MLFMAIERFEDRHAGISTISRARNGMTVSIDYGFLKVDAPQFIDPFSCDKEPFTGLIRD